MCTIAAEAALFFLGVHNVSLVACGEVGAGGGHIGQHSPAKQVVSSVGPVHSFSVLGHIVVHLTINLIMAAILNVGLVECDLEGVWELWGIYTKGQN